MSTDRTCRMSDLNAAKNELSRSIDSVRQHTDRVAHSVDDVRRSQQHFQKQADQLGKQQATLERTVSKQQEYMGELRGTVSNLQAQQDIDRRRVEQNEKVVGQIKGSIRELEQDLEDHSDLINELNADMGIVQADIAEARTRLSTNERLIAQLDTGISQVKQDLKAEAEQREAMRKQLQTEITALETRVEADEQARKEFKRKQAEKVKLYAKQTDSAAERIQVQRARQYDCGVQFEAANRKRETAHESYRQGTLEAAQVQFQESLMEFEEIERVIGDRMIEYETARAGLEGAMRKLMSEWNSLDLEAMEEVMHPEYKRLKQSVSDLKATIDGKEYEKPLSFAARMKWMADLREHMGQTQTLCATQTKELSETLRKIQDRIAKMRAVEAVLRERWGLDNSTISKEYTVKDDPRSNITLQTRRPSHMPNVTVFFNMDGSIQFSWTGYEGMECAADANSFEEALESRYGLKTVVQKYADQPGAPNKPDGGGQGKPLGGHLTSPEQVETKQAPSTRTKGA